MSDVTGLHSAWPKDFHGNELHAKLAADWP